MCGNLHKGAIPTGVKYELQVREAAGLVVLRIPYSMVAVHSQGTTWAPFEGASAAHGKSFMYVFMCYCIIVCARPRLLLSSLQSLSWCRTTSCTTWTAAAPA